MENKISKWYALKPQSGSVLFHPLLVPITILISFSLYLLQLSNVYSNVSERTIIYVLLCCALYTIGFYVAKRRWGNTAQLSTPTVSKVSAVGLRAVWILLGLCTAAFLVELYIFFARYQTLPLLSKQVETIRFALGENGYLHLPAMMSTTWVMVLSVFALLCVTKTRNRLLTSLAVLFVTGLALLTGFRGIIMLPIIMVTLALDLFYKLPWKFGIVAGLVVLYLLGASKFYREAKHSGNAIVSSINDDWAFGYSKATAPIYFAYLGASANFDYLNLYIKKLPNYHYGYFTIASPVYQIYPGHQYDQLDLQKDVLKLNFYGVLTSTFLGLPYIDFGFAGSIVVGLFGIAVGWLYYKVRLTYSWQFVLPYIYFQAYLLLAAYTYAFSDAYIWANLVSLYLVGKLVDRREKQTEVR
jgi:oligosaccharide repeat unit polymerase